LKWLPPDSTHNNIEEQANLLFVFWCAEIGECILDLGQLQSTANIQGFRLNGWANSTFNCRMADSQCYIINSNWSGPSGLKTSFSWIRLAR
jgi:hypothetical protein